MIVTFDEKQIINIIVENNEKKFTKMRKNSIDVEVKMQFYLHNI